METLKTHDYSHNADGDDLQQYLPEHPQAELDFAGEQCPATTQ